MPPSEPIRAAAPRPASPAAGAPIDRIIAYIDAAIRAGHFAPGDTITERQVTEALDTSRLSVREAFRILAGEGLLILSPNRGVRVRAFEPAEILEMMDLLAGLNVAALISLDLGSVGPDFFADLRGITQTMQQKRKAEDIWGVVREMSLFHRRILIASRNRCLQSQVRKVRIHHYFRSIVGLLGARCFFDGAKVYPTVLAALEKGDEQAAIRALVRMMKQSRDYTAPLSPHGLVQ